MAESTGTKPTRRAPARRWRSAAVRTGRELAFCLLSGLAGVGVLLLPAAMMALVPLGALLATQTGSRPLAGLLVAVVLMLAVAALLAARVGRGLAATHRRLAGWLLGERIEPPAAVAPRRGVRRLVPTGQGGDGAGGRRWSYLGVKVPLGLGQCYAAFVAVGGVADVSYPFWWGLFRNHPAGTVLDPVPALTPFPGVLLHVNSFGGTLGVLGLGVLMLAAAPWIAAGVVAVDRRLMRRLLGPDPTTQRLRDLEATRAFAVDDAAALLRRVERDLHDGAQVRLAALAMSLGMAREKLDAAQTAGPELAAARELVDAAHGGAKEALAELRALARGIHPPVLDNGLEEALASLAATGAVPVRVAADLPERPAAAIETIAYFCVAELLANAAKHSRAEAVTVDLVGHDGWLTATVTDDGIGGADPDCGTGLSGLAQRVGTVDGKLSVDSPPGGPTRVTVQLPLHTGAPPTPRTSTPVTVSRAPRARSAETRSAEPQAAESGSSPSSTPRPLTGPDGRRVGR